MMITRLLVVLVEIYLVCYKDKEKFGKYYFRLGNCTNPAVFLCSSGNESVYKVSNLETLYTDSFPLIIILISSYNT